MFSEEISRIVFTQHLFQLKALAPHSLLHPQGLGIEVPQFAQAWREQMPKAAEESVHMRRGSVRPRSLIKDWYPSLGQLP